MIAIANAVTNIGWTKEAEHQRIVNKAYEGMEITQVNWMYERLPIGHSDYDDLVAEVRLWSLQAVETFNPDFNTKFSSFLFGHLRMLSKRYLRAPWSEARRPNGTYVRSVSSLEASDGSARSLDSSHYFVNSPSADLQVGELVDNLSPRSREIFDLLTKVEDQDKLRDAFGAFRWRSQVSAMTGLPVSELETFKTEMQHKAPVYV